MLRGDFCADHGVELVDTETETERLMRKLALVVLVAAVLMNAFVMWSQKGQAKAQAPQTVAPYKVADLPNAEGVFKLVHQGCEIFVVRQYVTQVNHGDMVSVGIATGRGCK